MSFGDYLENKALDLAFSGASYSAPANIYADLFTVAPNDAGAGGTVVPTADGYPGRTAITNNTTNFPNASSRQKKLAVTRTIGTPTGAGWGTVVGIGLYDASTSGNFLGYADLGTDKDCVAGKRVKIFADELVISFQGAAGSGCWSDYLIHKILDHIFGATAFSPPASLYYALLTASAEHDETGYARIAKTNNATEFPAASGGAKSNGTIVTFGPAGEDWAQSTRVALYDDPSAGNQFLIKALTSPVTVLDTEIASFDPGEFDLSLS